VLEYSTLHFCPLQYLNCLLYSFRLRNAKKTIFVSLRSSGIKTKVIQNYKKPGRMLNVYIFLVTTLINRFDSTCLLTPLSRVLLEKLTSSKIVKKFPSFFGTRKFITAFTNTRHMSLSWTRSIYSMFPLYFLHIHLNIILPSTPGIFLEFSLPQVSSPSNETLYKALLCPTCATCPAYLILLDLITWIIFGEEQRS